MSSKKLPVGVRILLGFLSVILCVLLFVSTVVTIVVADFRVVTSKNGLQTIITQALFPTSAPVRLPAAGLAAGRPVIYWDEVDLSGMTDKEIEELLGGMTDQEVEDLLGNMTDDEIQEIVGSVTDEDLQDLLGSMTGSGSSSNGGSSDSNSGSSNSGSSNSGSSNSGSSNSGSSNSGSSNSGNNNDVGEDVMNNMGDTLSGLLSGSSEEAKAALVDAVYNIVVENVSTNVEVTREQVESFMNSSSVPTFITEKVAGVVNDLVTGESTTTLTKNEVVSLLEQNAAVIEQEMGVTITTDNIQSIGTWVEESKVIETIQQEVAVITGVAPPPSSGNSGSSTGNSGNNGSGSSSGEGNTGNGGNIGGNIGGSHQSGAVVGMAPDGKDVISNVVSGKDVTTLTIAEILAVVRTVTSVTALMICIGVCVVLIGLLFLTHWGRPFAAVRSAGIPVLIAGVLVAVPSVLAMAMPSLFTGLAMVIIRQVLTLTGYVSMGVAAFGLVLIVVGAVLNSVMKKRVRAKLAAAEGVVVEAPAEATLEEIAAEVLAVEE